MSRVMVSFPSFIGQVLAGAGGSPFTIFFPSSFLACRIDNRLVEVPDRIVQGLHNLVLAADRLFKTPDSPGVLAEHIHNLFVKLVIGLSAGGSG